MNNREWIDRLLYKFNIEQKQRVEAFIEMVNMPYSAINIHNAAKYILGQKSYEQALLGFESYSSNQNKVEFLLSG